MPAFSNKAMFIAPKSSQFRTPHNFTGTIRPGKLIPIAHFEGIPSEVHQARIAHLERFFPMLAPIMDRYDITIDSHFVPYRLINTFKAEKFFNDSTPDNEKLAEQGIPQARYTVILANMTNHHNKNITPIPSSLYDYLKYPFDSFVYRNIPTSLNTGTYADASIDTGSLTDNDMQFSDLIDINKFGGVWLGNATYLSKKNKPHEGFGRIPHYSCVWKFGTAEQSQASHIPTMWCYAANYYHLHIESFMGLHESWEKALLDLYRNGKCEFNVPQGVVPTEEDIKEYVMFDKLAQLFGFASYDQLVEQYQSLIYAFICYASEATRYQATGDEAVTPFVSLLPFLCYKRIYADRYVNTNFFDVDEYLSQMSYTYYDQKFGRSFKSYSTESVGTGFDNTKADYNSGVVFTDWRTSPRWWKNDAFTSATLSTQVDSDILIPTNGSIRDLRRASKIQDIKERALYAGKRFIDNIFAKFGVRSDDLRSLYTVKLGRHVSTIEVSDVMSTSGTDMNELGSYVGAAINSDRAHSFKYTVSEYGMFVIFASIMPKASYLDSVPKDIFKTDYYDFLSPEFASIGEQPILKSEVSFKLGNGSEVFGFNRRYYDYQTGTDNVCGRLRLDMDYWNSARDLSDGFVLDETFLVPDEEDRLNRIFANSAEGVDNIAMASCVEVEVIRPLPRFINYHL